MKVTSYAVARPAQYDRNATSNIQSDAAIYAPHTATSRWTTTVPSGFKLFLEACSVSQQNVTAPTTAAQASIIIRITSGASFMDPIRLDILTSGVITSIYSNQLFGQVTLYAGEILNVLTLNASTGGTILMASGAKGTQFAA
jgi:hypothetical protein